MKCLVVFALCIVAFAATNEIDDDESYNQWKKTICEGQNRTIRADIRACFPPQSEMVRDAAEDCMNQAAPSFKGDALDFIEVACIDKSVFKKYGACLLKYEADPMYRVQAILVPDMTACLEAVMKKYNLKWMDKEVIPTTDTSESNI